MPGTAYRPEQAYRHFDTSTRRHELQQQVLHTSTSTPTSTSCVFPYPVTPFLGGNFVSQLKYVDPVSSTFQPFQFFRLAVTLSVQAGFDRQSGFYDLDGSVMVYPRWTRHVKDLIHSTSDLPTRYRMERTLFRPQQALSFEISLINELTGDWIEPCLLNAPCECSAFDGMISSHISRARVQALLDNLWEQEKAAENAANWIHICVDAEQDVPVER